MQCKESGETPTSRGSIKQIKPLMFEGSVFDQRFVGEMSFVKYVRKGVTQTRYVRVEADTPGEVVVKLQEEHDHYYRE